MFINLTNHPSSQWDERQTKAARQFGEIEDMAFPQVNPNDSREDIEAIAEETAKSIVEKSHDCDVTVHIMGEMTFVYNLVFRLKSMGIRCVASTTERIVKDNDDGTKTSEFSFVGFREY